MIHCDIAGKNFSSGISLTWKFRGSLEELKRTYFLWQVSNYFEFQL